MGLTKMHGYLDLGVDDVVFVDMSPDESDHDGG